MLEQRLAWEIRDLENSMAQLLTEGGTPARGRGEGAGSAAGAPGPAHDAPTPAENLARTKLELVEQRLRLPPVVQGAPAVNDG